MKDFESKGFAAEKRIDKQTLAMFNSLEILNGMGCVKMNLYPSKYNENLAREFQANLFDGVDDSTNHSFRAIYVREHPLPSLLATLNP